MKILTLILLLLPVSSLAADISILDPYTISADESHRKVIQMPVPNSTEVAVVLTGCDTVSRTDENAPDISTFTADKRTVLITVDLPPNTPVGKLYPVHITTKEGRTHTIAIYNLGPDYKNQDVVFKTVIKSDTTDCQ